MISPPRSIKRRGIMPNTMRLVATGVAASAVAGTSVGVGATFSSAPMHHATRGSGPFFFGTHATRHLARIASLSLPSNGSDTPVGGDVWPTGIYWTMVEVGTPAHEYPVAIDSGSGDLDIGAVGCKGCVVTPPNRPYDHTASSTAKSVFPFEFSNSYQTCDLKDPTVGQSPPRRAGWGAVSTAAIAWPHTIWPRARACAVHIYEQ